MSNKTMPGNDPIENPTGKEDLPPGPGQIVIISGPSGVGKTTVLKKLFATCQLRKVSRQPLGPSGPVKPTGSAIGT
jgi:ABC-type lipoprotein export system ATPase subunit